MLSGNHTAEEAKPSDWRITRNKVVNSEKLSRNSEKLSRNHEKKPKFWEIKSHFQEKKKTLWRKWTSIDTHALPPSCTSSLALGESSERNDDGLYRRPAADGTRSACIWNDSVLVGAPPSCTFDVSTAETLCFRMDSRNVCLVIKLSGLITVSCVSALFPKTCMA